MALDFGTGTDLSSVDPFGGSSSIFDLGGQALSDVFGGVTQEISAAVPALISANLPQTTVPMTTYQKLTAPSGGGGMIARGLSRFPQLAAAIAAARSRGIALTVEKLWSLARRFGPNFLVQAGLLSAGALIELMLTRGTKKHKRMNVLNPRALSRSMRRLSGFQRRAAKVNAMLGKVGHRRRSAGRGRCMTCHRNPCTC
jgi:hypothetical protein